MEQFNLDKWLQDKSRKICTRDGRPARIVCTDGKNLHPLVAMITDYSGDEVIVSYTINGWRNIEEKYPNNYDLFFADEEKTNKILDELKSYLKNTPKEQVEKDWKEIQDWYAQHFTNEKYNEKEELTEFEKQLGVYIYFPKLSCEFNKEEKKYIRDAANTLLDLARKEIEKDAVEFAKSYMEDVNPSFEKVQASEELWKWKMSCLKGINKAYTQGKQDALKDLPKWRKATEYKDFEINEACILDDDIYPIIATNVNIGEYYLELDELKNLPLEK